MPPKPVPTEPADPNRKAGRTMALALRLLLNQVPGAREVLPHLAALERGLAAEGVKVLDIVPLASLKKMGAQLASLPVAADDLPLRALQVQLLKALDGRQTPVHRAPLRSTFLDADKLEVVEISASAWAAASQIAANGPGQA
jgi:hypothetical protein